MQERLTTREEEIYNYLLQGMSYYDIADTLCVERTTISTHVMRIFLKKMVNSRYELMAQRIKELENVIEELRRTNVIRESNQS